MNCVGKSIENKTHRFLSQHCHQISSLEKKKHTTIWPKKLLHLYNYSVKCQIIFCKLHRVSSAQMIQLQCNVKWRQWTASRRASNFENKMHHFLSQHSHQNSSLTNYFIHQSTNWFKRHLKHIDNREFYQYPSRIPCFEYVTIQQNFQILIRPHLFSH